MTYAVHLAKAILWEEIKGKLRALVVASMCYDDSEKPQHDNSTEDIEKVVEKFIADFEDAAMDC